MTLGALKPTSSQTKDGPFYSKKGEQMQDPALPSLVSDTAIFLEQRQGALLPPNVMCVPGEASLASSSLQKHPVVTDAENAPNGSNR